MMMALDLMLLGEEMGAKVANHEDVSRGGGTHDPLWK